MRILIVEDEAVAARGLERMLRQITGTRAESLRIRGSLEAARAHLLEDPTDLVFLDLNLHGEDGFDILRDFAAGAFQTIVVSASADRAIQAFEYGVLDFVAKPVSRERLELAVSRYAGGNPERLRTKYLSIRREDRTELIPIERVAYFEGADNEVWIHLRDGSVESHRKTLDSLERILPPRFVRIHRSYLLDSEQIEHFRVRPGGRYEVVLKDTTVLPVSRSRYKEIRAELDEVR